jgi:hypothetical protein
MQPVREIEQRLNLDPADSARADASAAHDTAFAQHAQVA